MEELKSSFPPDVEYSIVYDTTPFIKESIHEVFKALRDAIILVAIVVLAFSAIVAGDAHSADRGSGRNRRHVCSHARHGLQPQ